MFAGLEAGHVRGGGLVEVDVVGIGPQAPLRSPGHPQGAVESLRTVAGEPTHRAGIELIGRVIVRATLDEVCAGEHSAEIADDDLRVVNGQAPAKHVRTAEEPADGAAGTQVHGV